MKEKILITGHASGIGNHLARRFHELGYSIIGIDLNTENGLPAEIIQKQCDLSDEAAVVNMFGTLPVFDYAVNCAGVSGVRKEISQLTTNDVMHSWEKIFLPCFLSVREELSIMRRQSEIDKKIRKIINVSSFTALYGCKNMLAYSASKAAIINLTKVAAAENSPKLLINSVSPATINTPMIRKKYNGNLPDYSKTYLTGGCGSTEDVFSAVEMFMKNSFITGYDLILDGGFSSDFSLRL